MTELNLQQYLFPGALENALRNEESKSYFRNECLCKAMVDFNMIDTVSRGIKNMFNEQWRRHFSINTHQLPSYTKRKGLDKEKLRQMILQYLKNAGDEGAKRDSIYEYLRDVLPSNKTEEQQLRMVGKLLVEMDDNKLITTKGRKWIIRP